ncbi:FHA domain-containing protein [Pseudolysinimonas sp.]|uniref:FHA domain-containing protein n=1 Tax=Pseudolysinimonas sp. TaxID=2680009 RepID=UPI0037845CC2
METRFVPDAPGAWLVYDLGTLVLALPPEFRAAADAVAAVPRTGVDAVLAALRSSGIADAAPFAVLEATADGLRLALRGPATVSAGAETHTGLGADPWLERTVAGSAVVRLTVPGGEWTLTPSVVAAASALVPAPRVAAVASAAPAPLFDESTDITEIPDLEVSAAAPPPLQPLAPVIGEHDGSTVLASDLPARPSDDKPTDDKTVVVDEIARLRARRSAGLAQPVPPAPAPAVAPPPPPKLSLELPDGSRAPLDAVVQIGRAPSAPADAPTSRLVRLEGDGDISRNHARVSLDGDTVVVTDLGSRNGTIVRIPGRPAQKLRDGEPTPVLVGTVIDFGGGVELSVREN